MNYLPIDQIQEGKSYLMIVIDFESSVDRITNRFNEVTVEHTNAGSMGIRKIEDSIDSTYTWYTKTYGTKFTRGDTFKAWVLRYVV